MILVLLLSMLLTSCILVGCGNGTKDDGKLSIVTTIFPEYDWVKQILGDEIENAELTLLLNSGADLHNYQPTADDIVKIASCDMFIYVGSESDEWVEGALAQATNKDMVVINLFELLGDKVKEEEVVDGMEKDEHGEEHGEEHGDEHEGESEGAHVNENDEHVWLSLANAKVICKEIANQLSTLDPDNADKYTQNVNQYCDQLTALHNEYKAAVDAANTKTLLFADRFPFRYLVDDYGLSYYAAFAGCSAETEASFETIAFLAGKVDELGLKSVIKIEGSDDSIATTIIGTSNSKNAKILTMNSLQTTTTKDAANGVTYLSVMKSNLEVLKEALE